MYFRTDVDAIFNNKSNINFQFCNNYWTLQSNILCTTFNLFIIATEKNPSARIKF